MRTEIRYTYATTPDRFWATYLSEDHVRRMYDEGLGAEWLRIDELTGDVSGTLRRRLECSPRVDANAVARKVFGSRQRFVEEGSWDAGEQVWRYRVIPSMQARRVHITGRVSALAVDSGVEVTYRLDVEARLPLVGKPIEAFITRQFRDNLAKQFRFTQGYIAGQSQG